MSADNENALATIVSNNVVVAGDDMFDAIKTSGKYLPRLQLMTSNSGQCKAGEFPINHYARVADSDYRDLGTSVDVFIGPWRPMALWDTPDGNMLISYNPMIVDGRPTGVFAEIQAEADKPGMTGAMYGPQFLLWVPSCQEFMTFFMASKTARRASTQVKALMGHPGTLGSKKIESKEHVWFGPTCVACSTPFEMPAAEELKRQVDGFNSPEEPAVEPVAEEDQPERDQ